MASVNLPSTILLMIMLNVVLGIITAMTWGISIEGIVTQIGDTLTTHGTGLIDTVQEITQTDWSKIPIFGQILYSYQGALNMAILGIKLILLVLSIQFSLPIALMVTTQDSIIVQVLGMIGYGMIMWFNLYSFMAIKSWWGGSKT